MTIGKSVSISGICGLVVLLTCTVTLGGTLYVATNGDDSSGVDWSQAFTTIQGAVNAAAPDDLIIVGSSGTGHGTGIYAETVDVSTAVTIESESGYETTTVGYAGATDHIFDVRPNVDYVTIRGFSIFGATASGDWQQGAIHLDAADHCTIENNRCGWDPAAYNQMGIYMESAHYNTIKNNICNENVYVGIRLWGCDYNIITDNECSNSTDGNGIHLYVSCDYNFIANNQCNFNYYGIYIQNSGENTIAYNCCDHNKYYGVRIMGNHYNNATIGNVLSNSTTYDGFSMSNSTGGVVANNRIFGNKRRAVSLSTSAKYSHFYLNYINGSISSEFSAENYWSTPTEMCYFYNPTVKSVMGNYYVGMDHTDTDGDGITDADKDLPGAEHTDEYPLAAEPNQYNYKVQTWYVGSDDHVMMDPAGVPGWFKIVSGESHIWFTEDSAAGEIDFKALDPNDGWTGRIRFDATVDGSDYTVEVGYAEPNGADFTAGPQITLSGSFSMFTFETNGASFTLPSGKSLGMRVTNNSAADVQVRKGAFSYISAPGGISQAWPGVLLGDIAGDTGVNLVDFSFLATRWGDVNCGANNDCEGADIDKSGEVDMKDLGILCGNWLIGIDN